MFNFPGPGHLAALIYNPSQGQHLGDLEGNQILAQERAAAFIIYRLLQGHRGPQPLKQYL